MHWRKILIVSLLAGAASSSATAGDVTFLTDAQLREAIRSAPALFPGVTDLTAIALPSDAQPTVYGLKRTKPTAAEVHAAFDDVWYVLEGTATLVTGGALVDGKGTEPGETRGPGIKDGDSRQIRKGDFAYIPAGTPHWVSALEGDEFLYLVVKVPSRPAK
jgi:glc operon protein GlcG